MGKFFLGSGNGRFPSIGVIRGVSGRVGAWVDGAGVARLSDKRSLVSELVETSDFKAEVMVPFDMVTVPAGAPSIRSGWLDALRVIRSADPGGMETFVSEREKSTGEVEDFGKLTRIVFFPAELNP